MYHTGSEKKAGNSLMSANIILKYLFSFYKPNSIIDIGCGSGEWLTVAKSYGIKYLVGSDINNAYQESLVKQNIQFVQLDFSKSYMNFEGKFGMCFCLYVIEYLPQARTSIFIKTLCNASDIIVFSTAYKMENNHAKPLSYWAKLFSEQGFECFDIIRPYIWDNEQLDWSYRQGILVFINKTSPILNNSNLKRIQKPVIDIIHPDFCEKRAKIVADHQLCMIEKYQSYLRDLLKKMFDMTKT